MLYSAFRIILYLWIRILFRNQINEDPNGITSLLSCKNEAKHERHKLIFLSRETFSFCAHCLIVMRSQDVRILRFFVLSRVLPDIRFHLPDIRLEKLLKSNTVLTNKLYQYITEIYITILYYFLDRIYIYY